MTKKKSFDEMDDVLFAAHTPLSNTGCGSSKGFKYSVCIDYLKVTFDGNFLRELGNYEDLFQALVLDLEEFDESYGGSFYSMSYIYDENVRVYFGGRFTNSKTGKPTWMLELKGEACRDFELRGGDWLTLIDTILRLGGRGRRLDVAIDDFSGQITCQDLKEKISSNLYVCKFRRIEAHGDKKLIGGNDDDPEIIVSKNGGFTATFGGRSTKQLCIYNKKAERAAKDYRVFTESWIRYECRFYGDACPFALLRVYESLKTQTESKMAIGMLTGLIEFKEPNNEQRKNLGRAPTWQKWKMFLEEASIITFDNQARKELTLAMKYHWFTIACGPTLAKIFLSGDDKDFESYLAFVVMAQKNKMNHQTLASVNYLRKSYNRKPFDSVFDLVTFLENRFGQIEATEYIKSIMQIDENDEMEVRERERLENRKRK